MALLCTAILLSMQLNQQQDFSPALTWMQGTDGGGPVWANDNKTFFYLTLDATGRASKVCPTVHWLGHVTNSAGVRSSSRIGLHSIKRVQC